MNDYLLTICVPAYNVEDYIAYNIESILSADLNRKIEVLVVDDGSTDKTTDIVSKYVSKNPNIRLIKKSNGNYGSCINVAKSEAKGKYFKIIDGDDYVDSKALNNLVQKLDDVNVDLVLTPFKKIYQDSEIVEIIGTINNPNFGQDFEKSLSERFEEFMFLVDKNSYMVKTGILRDNDIIIDENSFYVDLEFILYLMPYINTFHFENEVIYVYRVGRVGQSMNTDNLIRNTSMLENVIKNLHEYKYKHTISTYKFKAYKRVMCAAIRTKILTYFHMKYSIQTFKKLNNFADMVRKFDNEEYDHFKINRLIINFPILYFILYPLAKGLSIG